MDKADCEAVVFLVLFLGLLILLLVLMVLVRRSYRRYLSSSLYRDSVGQDG